MTKKDKNSSKDPKEILNNLVNELFDLIGLDISFSINYEKENDAFLVNIDAGEAAGLLIGARGETLNSLQMILGMMLKNELGEWKRIVFNVGDWREKHEEYLKNLALQTAERVRETGQEQSLYNLTPAQRRIIHVALAETEDVVTESVGEGEERYLVVKPRPAN